MLPQQFPATDLVAHRGLAASYPENTVLALQQALKSGTRIVEFDIQLSANGVPVVIHDEALLRTCGIGGTVGDFTAEALCHVHCGYADRFGDRFADLTIATHAAAVATLGADPSACLLAEIKDESIARFGLRACMEPVLRALEPWRDRVALISFQSAAVAYAQAQGFAVGYCLDNHDAASRDMARRLQPDLLLTDEVALVRTDDLWPGPWRWACWEVAETRRARELFELGVDYVETMACDRLRAAPALGSWLA